MKRRLTIGLAWMGLAFAAQAQVTLKAELDTPHIRLGEPIKLTIIATYPEDVEVLWPTWEDQIEPFHIIEDGALQKEEYLDGYRDEKELTITAFDTGFQVLPPVAVEYRKRGETRTDSIATEPALVRVDYVEVDTSQAFKPIKPPQTVPRHWTEWAWMAAIPVGLILLGLLGFWLYRKYKNRPEPPPKEEFVPERAAHEVALEKLDELKKEELWQQGEVKTYQDRVSDIVREYIEARWGVPALEYTTDEVHQAFARIPIARELVRMLIELLERADLAKFAKGEPLPEEHEESMRTAVRFVKETIQEPEMEEAS